MTPGRAESLARLPPAYIAVDDRHDPLRNDGCATRSCWRPPVFPSEVHNAKTLVHGYVGYASVVPAATAARERELRH